jgi:hypothetical protein
MCAVCCCVLLPTEQEAYTKPLIENIAANSVAQYFNQLARKAEAVVLDMEVTAILVSLFILTDCNACIS